MSVFSSSTIRHALFLTVLPSGLVFSAVASAKTVRMGRLGASVSIPAGWKKTAVAPGKSVTFSMPKGGKFSVTRKAKKLPLKRVAAGIKKRGAKLGWRLLQERRNILHRGKRAHLLVYQIPTSKPGVKVRAAFYLVNTPNGYYTLFFGTKRKHFRNGLYKAVYRTFRVL